MYLPKQFAVQPTPSPKAGMAGVSVETQVLGDNENMVELKESSNYIPAASDDRINPSVVGDWVEGRSQRPPQDDPGDMGSAQDQKPMALTDDQPEISDNALAILDKPKEKPLSRAERRKKIKEEILAAGEGEGFKGYKRRQW
jgi:hypothetical protein